MSQTSPNATRSIDRKYANIEGFEVMYNEVIKKLSECPNLQINLKECPCTYKCNLKGRCCECLRNHRANNELPACYFSPEVEKTYDRSIKKFVSMHR